MKQPVAQRPLAPQHLNLKRIRLLTNHPSKVASLKGFGIGILEQVPLSTTGNVIGH